jgi:hypothetical protein
MAGYDRQYVIFSSETSSLTAIIMGHYFNKFLSFLVSNFRLVLNVVRGVSKKLGELYQKTNKIDDTNKLTLSALKIIAILYNTLLVTFIKLLESVSKDLFRNRSQNHCHTFLDCRHVCKTCAFYDALQAGKQKDVPVLIWRPQANL